MSENSQQIVQGSETRLPAQPELRRSNPDIPRERRYRTSSPRQQAIALPPYDIRVRRELAHRRTLVAMARHVTRVVALHILDGICAASAAFIALRIVPADAAGIVPLLTGLTLLGLEGRGAYQPADGRRSAWRIISGVALAYGASAMISIFALPYHVPIALLTVYALAATLLVLLERLVVDKLVRRVYEEGVGLRRAIILGRSTEAEWVAKLLSGDSAKDHSIVGHVVPGPATDPTALGTLVDLEQIITREEPAELILCAQLPGEAYRRVADICVRNGVSLLALPSWTKMNRGWVEPVFIGDLAGFWLHPVRLEVPELVVKRITDLVLTSLAIVVFLPLIAIIALAIKLESRGPVFFRQRRVGLGGREFTIWKFRSMRVEAERARADVLHLNHYSDGRLFKLQNDPRITRVGKILRRFSLDELPQLFNVISGDMSLVGPRPPLPSEVVSYESRHFVRLTVVPGITGPWQVNGRNLIRDFEEVVRLERAYVEQWSFKLDLEIMFKTVGVVLSGRGAY